MAPHKKWAKGGELHKSAAVAPSYIAFGAPLLRCTRPARHPPRQRREGEIILCVTGGRRAAWFLIQES
jgi:hypothetical protein